MKKPNFFIVGAPKCGTTALSEYLKSHPNIFITDQKEPHYFATDLPGRRTIFTQLENYLELYKECGSSHIAIGEASVWYLYSMEALNNIYQFDKNAKIIVMIRNPVEMVYSLYSQHRNRLNEDQKNFKRAWELQSARKYGHSLPHRFHEPILLQYGDIGKFGKQLEQAYSIFPPKQIKVIIFDDFITSTRNVYQEVLEFLGLPDDGRMLFSKMNENKVYRYNWLQLFLRHPPNFLVILLQNLKYLKKVRQFIIDWLTEKNSIKVQRTPLPEEFRKELKDFFHDDVKNLSKLLGRDLMYWVE